LKKLTVLLLVLVFTALLFSGCGTDSGTGDPDGAAPDEGMVSDF
jgi:hypothetical protein